MSLSVQIEKSFPGGFHLAVEFTAEDEILGLLGPSGCGKSMTLRCIAGIEKPDAGKIVLNGTTLYDSAANICLTPQKRRTGYMFQNYALFPNFTVAENIAAGLQNKTKEEKARLVAEQLESLHLTGLADRYPKQLSGGQQQRVALARILASSPDILMLDEPFSALDSHLRYQLEESFQDTLSHYPGTVLYVSHSNEEIYRYCDRVALLCDGHLKGLMMKETLFREPQTLSGAQLTACRNISPIQQKQDGLYAELWQIPLPTPDKELTAVHYVGIREETIVLSKHAQPGALPVEILSCYPIPGDVVVTFRYGEGKPLRCRHKEAKPGETWYCIFPASALLWLR